MSKDKGKKKHPTGLGKGLGAFFTEDFQSREEEAEKKPAEALTPSGEEAEDKPSSPAASPGETPPQVEESAAGEGQVYEIDVNDIRPNPYQPRRYFDAAALQELADSISEQGILQPITVRQSLVKGYELIAGERRLRAAKMAGLDTVPALVRQMTDAQMIESSIIENLQREDLTPLEEAQAYKNMMESLQLTQAETAKRLGKSRSHVANMVRLLDLNDEVKDLVQEGKLSMGQARTLLGVKNKKDQTRLAKKAVHEGLTVRQLEKMVQALNEPARPAEDKPKKPQKPAYIRESEDRLMDKFGTNVQIRTKGEQGKIEIEYLSQEDLTRILDLLNIRFED